MAKEATSQVFNLHPSALFMNLERAMIEVFARYDKLHPANQSVSVRICLRALRNKMNDIKKASENITHQQCYQLCGLFLKMADEVLQDKEFSYAILSVIKNISLNQQECKIAYQDLDQSDMRKLASQLTMDEAKEYNEAYQALRNKVCQLESTSNKTSNKELENAYMRAYTLLQGIAIKGRENKNPGDIKYCTTVSKLAVNLMENPDNVNIRHDFSELAKHDKDGISDNFTKFAGVMMAFLGAVMVAGSLLLQQLSLHFSAPLTMVGVVGGGLFFLQGVNLFQQGRQKGVSKAITLFGKCKQYGEKITHDDTVSTPSYAPMLT